MPLIEAVERKIKKNVVVKNVVCIVMLYSSVVYFNNGITHILYEYATFI